MPPVLNRARLAALIVTGMALLLAGVVAGAAIGTLIRSQSVRGTPVLVGESNAAADTTTQLVAGGKDQAVVINQHGTGLALNAVSDNGPGARFETKQADRNGVLARNTSEQSGSGAALMATGGQNTAVHATSSDGIGVWAESSSIAIYGQGQTVIEGDVSIRGACVECLVAAIAVNASDQPLQAGQAVTVIGVTTDDAGQLLLKVTLATAGDPIIGIVDTAARQVRQRIHGGTAVTYYASSSAFIGKEALLLVVTGGIVQHAQADPASGPISAGDMLIAGDTPGSLSKMPPNGPSNGAVGYALGQAENGYVPVWVSPH